MVIVWASWTEFVSNVLRVCLTTKPFLLPILINVFERTTSTTCKIRRRCKLWWFVVCPRTHISLCSFSALTVFLFFVFVLFVTVFFCFVLRLCRIFVSAVGIMGLKPNP